MNEQYKSNPQIAIIGFGKIGRAIAAHMLQHECGVLAIDTDPKLAEAFRSASFHSGEPGVDDILYRAVADKRLSITRDFDVLEQAAAVIVAIPLMVDESKNIIHAPFLSCMKEISARCRDQQLIIIETSVPVGYCRNTLLPELEKNGKRHGVDFLLAHSPERIKSGTMLLQLQWVPKVIGGITDLARDRAIALYQLFFRSAPLHSLASIEAAEMLKLAGMIYRDVNIALSNQLAQFAQSLSIDFPALIPLINTDKEANLLFPGIGVGGHCTPVYPYFMIENFKDAGLDFSLARLGRSINDGMAAYSLSLVKDKIVNKKALVLGLGFRPDIKEDAFSSGALLYSVLKGEGFDVSMHDSQYSADELFQKGFTPGDPGSSTAEVIFLVTMHREYHSLNFQQMADRGTRFFVDGRNAVRRSSVEAAGITYMGIGR